MKAYVAHAMTGRSGKELHEESQYAKEVLAVFGIETLDPVLIEGVDPLTPKLANTLAETKEHWARDKKCIRECDVLIDLTPNLKSEGVSHEIGYARYFLWRPVVRVGAKFPENSIAYFEDDIIAPDLWEAALEIKERFGTRKKRLLWRLNLYRRCVIKAWWYKLRSWK